MESNSGSIYVEVARPADLEHRVERESVIIPRHLIIIEKPSQKDSFSALNLILVYTVWFVGLPLLVLAAFIRLVWRHFP